MTHHLLPLSLSGILCVAACTPIPASPGATGVSLSVGQSVPMGFSANGKPVYAATWRVADTEESGFQAKQAGNAHTSLILLQEGESLLDASQSDSVPELTPDLSLAEIKSFLDDHWDPYVAGKDDPGRNGAEFSAELERTGLPADAYIALFRQTGVPMSLFGPIMQQLVRYGAAQGAPGCVTPLEELRAYRLTLRDLLQAVNAAGYGALSFFDTLSSQKRALKDLLQACAERDNDLPGAIKAELTGFKTAAVSSEVDDTVAITDHIQYPRWWYTIVDNRLTGRLGYFLAERSLSESSYRGGETFSDGPYRIWYGDSNNPLAEVEWRYTSELQLQHIVWNATFARKVGATYSKVKSQLGWYLTAGFSPTAVRKFGRSIIDAYGRRVEDGPQTVEATVRHHIATTLIPGVGVVWRHGFTLWADSKNGVQTGSRVDPPKAWAASLSNLGKNDLF